MSNTSIYILLWGTGVVLHDHCLESCSIIEIRVNKSQFEMRLGLDEREREVFKVHEAGQPPVKF